jgi:hypothetical protein
LELADGLGECGLDLGDSPVDILDVSGQLFTLATLVFNNLFDLSLQGDNVS